MMNLLPWLQEHWTLILAAAWLVISICNVITKHYGYHVGLKRVLALIVDLLSVLTSSGSPGGPIKLPGQTSLPPNGNDRVGERLKKVTRSSILLGMLLALGGCAGTWQDQLRAGIGATADVAKVAVSTVRGDGLCRPQVEACKAQADRTKCREKVRGCQQAQVAFLLAVNVLSDQLELVAKALDKMEATK